MWVITRHLRASRGPSSAKPAFAPGVHLARDPSHASLLDWMMSMISMDSRVSSAAR
jgi:hypothetical protein